MLEVIAQLCGGIGLFLIGMTLMTDSLKEMAGESLRLWLSKFTGSPIKAIFSGIGLTLAVQSSTATTLATIGFVSAGILTFSQAIGVIIGANIGTTSTGWMVAFLGVKFSIAHIALPLIGLGAIFKLFSRGRLSLFGLTIAGFGLIFFGIDLLQVAMSGFAERVDLSVFSNNSFTTQLILVLVGLVMTVLLQSSSAAITATLAALASGAIDLSQALGLVIGQNIGTVATAILAAMGSTANAKRTAAVHVVFNVISAVLAFILLKPAFLWLAEHSQVGTWDDVIIVAAFHTAFSVLGTLFLLPFLKQFEQLIVGLIPDRTPSILCYLDQASFSVPALAINAASKVIYWSIGHILILLKRAIQEGRLPSNSELQQLDEILKRVQQYLEDLSVSENELDQQRLMAMLRLMVYLRVLRSDLEAVEHAEHIRTQPTIYQMGLDYIHVLDNHFQYVDEFNRLTEVASLNRELLNLKQWVEEQRAEAREKVIEYATVQHLSAARSLELLDAQRWLDRLIAHTQRLANVLQETESMLDDVEKRKYHAATQ